MTRPVGLVYPVDETPPLGVTVFSAGQHVGLITSSLVFPVLLAREAGLSDTQLLDSVSLCLLALGVATILLCLRSRYFGSRYLCPAGYTPIYFAPSLYALQHGGLGMIYGMTIVSGLVQLGIAPLLRRLRSLFPPEIAGLVVAISGLTLAIVGARYSFGIRGGQGVQATVLVVSGITLATMLALNIWGKGYLKMFAVMIGALVGDATSVVLGLNDFQPVVVGEKFSLFSWPGFDQVSYAFDASLILPFAVVALAGTLNLIGDVSTAQKINNADWVRPEFRSLSGGLASNGVASVLGGLVGSPGVNTLSSSIGLSGASGVTSRTVGYWIGAALVMCAFVPLVAGYLVATPEPVVGATLFFSSAFIFINGMQMITSRMLDTRKIFVIGFSFALAVMTDIYQSVFAAAPPLLQPIFGNALVLGTASAMLLNLILRIGVRQRESMRLAPDHINREAVEQFMSEHGARWAARHEIVDRATFGVAQALDVLGRPAGDIEIEASFDEFNFDVWIRYPGMPLTIPEVKPSAREIVADERGERLFAGYLLRQSADTATSRAVGARAEIHLHYDH
jgi:NCS2 family nucleobase:cation symporter-2